jgi:hypothetical protein
MGLEMATSQDFANYVCGERLHNHFLVHLFRYMAPEWTRLMAGSTHNSIYMPVFRDLQILLPALPEQRAIARAIEDVDALLDALTQLIAKKRDLKQAAIQELLTGKKRLPGFSGEWKLKRLDTVSDIDRDNLESATPSGYAFSYISLEDVDVGCLRSYSEQVFSSAPSRARRRLRAADVLISTVRPNLQSHLLFALTQPNWICSTGFSVVRCKSEQANPGYIYYQLFGHCVTKQIESLLTGSNYPAINGRDVRALEIPVPNLPEQTAIAAVLSDMDAEIAALESRRDKTRALKQGIMQELLTGRTRLVSSEAASPVQNEKRAVAKSSSHNWAINEAVVISVLAKQFGTETFPLGRKRCTKLAYLLHRHMEKEAEGYLKKAAGPYNPSTKYKGPESIAQRNGYVRTHASGRYSGFVAAHNIEKAEAYFLQWYGLAALQWIEQFRFSTNDELELLATVDMAVADLQNTGEEISLQRVKDVIRGHPEWEAKLTRAVFADANITAAMKTCEELFD